MTIIDWATPLAAIATDNASVAIAIGAKVTHVGTTYDRAGHPDFMTESAAHVAWRADYASQLAAHDKTAASVDGLPLTTIDPANPAASRVTVVKRLAVVFGASGAVGVLIADMQKSPLPPEPLQWVDGYYVAPTTTREFKTVGDIEAALVAALAELAAYISFR